MPQRKKEMEGGKGEVEAWNLLTPSLPPLEIYIKTMIGRL